MSEKLTWAEQKQILTEGLSGEALNVTETLLENQRKNPLFEAVGNGSNSSNFARIEKSVLPIVRRVAPAMLAMDLVGVQPMTQPVGLATALRAKYANGVTDSEGNPVVTAGDEASGQHLYEKYSMIAAGEDYNASDARSAAEITAALERQLGNEIEIEIVKQSVEAKTRKLQAKFTLEAQEDAEAMHGVALQSELVAAVSDQILRETDRELLLALESLAGTVKTFDFASADGRYGAEKFSAITIGMSDLSSRIALKTKLAGATWMVISSNLHTALLHADNGLFTPVPEAVTLNRTTYVGNFAGRTRVYVDPHATSDTILMGYKGNSAMETGFVYLPYVPLQQSGIMTDSDTGDRKVALRTRYATCAFTDTDTSLGNSADFYSRGTVSNLKLGF